MILNTHDPCPSDLMVRTAPVFWLVIAHSAPGTAALELSRTMARNELETFCANARLAAQARIAINLENFFMEPPIVPATPVGCPEPRRGPQAVTKRRAAGNKLKRSIYPKTIPRSGYSNWPFLYKGGGGSSSAKLIAAGRRTMWTKSYGRAIQL